MTHYVIIGGSAAGIQAAEDTRRLDRTAEITVVSAEKHYPYSRCLISRYVEGKLTPEGLRFRTGHFFEDLGVRGLLNTRVERIDPAAKQVYCADGDAACPTTSCCWRPGRGRRRRRIPGAQLGNVFTFHTMEDAERIVNAARTAASTSSSWAPGSPAWRRPMPWRARAKRSRWSSARARSCPTSSIWRAAA